MTQTMLEYVLSSMYIAIASAALDDYQRAVANDTLFQCADLPCAPTLAPEILRRIASHAVSQDALFDAEPPRSAEPEPEPRHRFQVIDGGRSSAPRPGVGWATASGNSRSCGSSI